MNSMITVNKNIYPDQKVFPKELMPYSAKESLKWLWRLFFVSRKNPHNIEYIPKKVTLNKIKPELTLGFFGDIMDIENRRLEIKEDVKNFFYDCDYIIGNLEGTYYKGKKETFLDQSINQSIIEAIKTIKAPEKTYLSIANNHTGDFSESVFNESIEFLINEKFNLFGGHLKNNPSTVVISNEVELTGVTRWSNRKRGFERAKSIHLIEEEIVSIKNENSHLFKIIFPHWGYENVLYPQKETKDQGSRLLNAYDCLVGSHSHCPQPVTLSEDNKICAFSLGNFCFRGTSYLLNRFCWGIILKFTLGKSQNGFHEKLVVGEIEWNFVKMSFDSENNVITHIVDEHGV